MRITTSKILTATAIVGLLFSCKKEQPVDPVVNNPANPTPTTTMSQELLSFFERNEVAPQTFSMNANETKKFVLASDAQVQISGGFVDASGNSVTGNVDIEIQEIYSKSNMILSNKPTLSNQGILTSAGEFSIIASQNGTRVYSANSNGVEVFVPTANNQTDMDFWIASENDDDFLWEVVDSVDVDLTDSTDVWQDSIFIDPMDSMVWDSTVWVDPIYDYYYNVTTSIYNNFDWINLDVLVPSQGCGTGLLNINVTEDFTQYNTSVFVVITDYNGVVNVYSYDDHTFTLGNYYELYNCLNVDVIGISAIDGELYFGTENVTIDGTTEVNLHLVPTTEDQILSQINNL